MLKKVLIVDDHDDINSGVLEVLNILGISNVQQAQYCDEAALKIKRALLDKEPFDLLITDLSFKKDHRVVSLENGEDLIAEIRKENSDLPIIVYSMVDLLQKVRTLVTKFQINGYVCKGRRGSAELSQAITTVFNKQRFLSVQVSNALSSKTNIEIDDFDIALVKQLSLGKVQNQISKYFVSINVSPSSVSSIEKRLNKLRIQFRADNATHLVAKMKDLGLI